MFKLSCAVAQDSTDYYIKRLSWGSLFIKPTYATELVLNKDAENLISYKNDNTVKKLFCAMSDDTKTVAVHMILSRMFEPQDISFTQKSVYKGDSITAVNYTYNTLLWRYDIKTERYSIEPTAVNMIKEYWEKKLPVLQNMSKAAKRKQSKKCNKALKRGL